MDYFFSRLGRGFRYSATILGSLACGVVIVLGAIGIQTIVIPICGGIALIPMGMVLLENTKILRDIEKMVTKLKMDLDKLKEINQKLETNVVNLSGEIDELHNVKDMLLSQNKHLETLLGEAKNSINEMNELVKSYESNIKILEHNIKNSETNLKNLQHTTKELLDIKERYEIENKILNDNLEKIATEMAELTVIKESYKTQLEKMAENNDKLSDISESLKAEINNINQSYEEAKDIIETLLRSKNVLNDIYGDMIKTEEKTEQNVGMMSRLLNVFGMERSKELFKTLDTDGDNVLTQNEFIEGVLNNDLDNDSENI